MKHKKVKKYIIIIILILIVILKIIPMCLTKIIVNKDKENISLKFLEYKNKGVVEYSLPMLFNYAKEAKENEKINLELANEDDVVYNENYNFEIQLINEDEDSNYEIEYGNKGKSKREELYSKQYNYSLEEGKNEFVVTIYKEQEKIGEFEKTVYYVEKYKNQFLEQLNKNGVQVHYKRRNYEQYDKDIDLLVNLGVNYVRVGMTWELIEKEENVYDFSYNDTWMSALKEKGIKVLANVGTSSTKYIGDDKKINTEEELAHFLKFVEEVNKHYDYVEDYEVLNEPNYSSNGYCYKEKEDINWYYRIAEEVGKVLNGKTVNFGSLSGVDSASQNNIPPTIFLESIGENIAKTNTISIHPYDWYNYNIYNVTFKRQLDPLYNYFKDFGGFYKVNATEYGSTSFSGHSLNEEIQAYKLVQQTVLLDRYDIYMKLIYNLWNVGTNLNAIEDNYGLITNDYKPKLSYYAIKNLNENINGAEYIGEIDMEENLNCFVYDKDGKAKAIMWNDKKKDVKELPYEGFIAKDLYGNIIENTNGKLNIGNSPVYLDEITDKYFYKAISNTAVKKYKEFKEKFSDELAQLPDVLNKINQEETFMLNIENKEGQITEKLSIQAMESYFDLGNLIIQKYSEGKLNIEYIKLSSMLGMLNSIGDLYEDLVTIVSKTVDQNELEQTNEKIQEVEKLINDNNDLEIIYPNKILEFSKDYYEKAKYINSQEEENDIKEGLMISKNLHAKFLAKWAEKFTQLYIEEYIANNPVKINYSETEITNKDVKAEIQTNAVIQIVNNDGSKEYTFEENGAFVFEYTIKGHEFTIATEVNNIDKQAPQIPEIENGKSYNNKIKINVIDQNLSEVKITFNDEEIEYKPNMIVSEEGFYTIIANDLAGNTTTVNFQILEEQGKYQIKEKVIQNISNNTKRTDFTQQLKLATSYEIKRDEEVLKEDDIIATGDILETSDGKEYTLIVAGDLNRDGDVNIKDLIKMRKFLLDRDNLDEVEQLAADCNSDGKTINIKDFIRMRIIALTKETEIN